MSKDQIQRFIFKNAHIRGELVQLTSSYQTIVSQHKYPSALQKILGEVLAAVSLLSATIKISGRLTVQFQGKDPLKLLLAQCNHQFEIRGLAQWTGDLSESEILTALKKGTLVITITPDKSTTPYQGIVSWQEESLAKNIEIYFRDSEQLPTRLWLSVNDKTAAGLLLQKMPEFSDEDWSRIIYLTETITPDELLSLDTNTLLYRLYSEEEVEVFPSKPIAFGCTCSVARSENSILMLGIEEVEEELNAKQKIVVTCEFCNKDYIFDRAAIVNIFKRDNGSSTSIH